MEPPSPEERRRRRRERVFGEVLPDRTSDESDQAEPPEPPEPGTGRDDWLRDQVPPHHG